ncbi:zinc ABC transporter substrate-binding protein [Hoeflea sp.]|uniref:zinc ABC transporter substrate-binding protein n=1 Tax=Hoeflea sp. TaxID=1940281 RepID=UPI002AFE021E|nr:zinc ABC transporter substrate-binding protein [Hoeflea sp.]
MIFPGRTVAAVATAFSLSLLSLTPASAEPRVVASIKPVHSLVAAVMEGVGTPELIVGGAASPHSYALKPSQAQALENAELIFWVGPNFETFLEKPIETIAKNAHTITLMEAEGLHKLPFRAGGAFEAHVHSDGDTDGHDVHDHDSDGHEDHAQADADTDHDHADANHDADGHDDDHDHGGYDAHVWLDPANAKAFVAAISAALANADPANAAAYAANAHATNAKLDALGDEVEDILAPVHDKHFIVFHDAYQYFEKRFNIEAAGSITVNPDVRPSAERLTGIRDKVRELDAVCAFSEPQFESRLVDVAVEGSNARPAVLDPLGATLTDGPELYFDLIRELATSMRDCLAGD